MLLSSISPVLNVVKHVVKKSALKQKATSDGGVFVIRDYQSSLFRLITAPVVVVL